MTPVAGVRAPALARRGRPAGTVRYLCPRSRRGVLAPVGVDRCATRDEVRADRLVGATMVASHAGEMISEITLAMVKEVGLGSFTEVIHPYPTQAEAIKAVAGLYTRTRLTPLVKRLFDRWMAISR